MKLRPNAIAHAWWAFFALFCLGTFVLDAWLMGTGQVTISQTAWHYAARSPMFASTLVGLVMLLIGHFMWQCSVVYEKYRKTDIPEEQDP